MSSVIKFGTSGWRAIVADEFTLANIRLAIAGIAAYVKTQPEPHRVLVGRDPRFLGESFVAEAAKILAGGRHHSHRHPRRRANPGHRLCGARPENLRRHQLHRLPQSTGVQRHQVLHPRRRARPAGSDQAD